MILGAGRQRAFVGLGANLGDARATLKSACADLQGLPRTLVAARSSIYRSAPVQAAGPDFRNAVVELQTDLEPIELLHALQAIEQRHGRQRPYRNAPRTLDLDLLLYGTVQCSSRELVLPHPRLHLRAFVVRPLLEIAPELDLPGLGRLSDWIESVRDQSIENEGR